MLIFTKITLQAEYKREKITRGSAPNLAPGLEKKCKLSASNNPNMIRLLIVFLFSFICFSCETLFEDEDLKIIYFPNSDLIKQSIEYKDGKKSGAFKEFYRNGNPKTIQHYRNDTLTDTSFFFFENGVLGSLQIFKNGGKTGCWKKFNKQGREYWNVTFKNGLLDGKAEEYSYRTIRLLTRNNYFQGKKQGRQESYYPNGKPKSITYFEDGLESENAQEWDEKGKEIHNDFSIHVTEKNLVLLENKLTYYITLDNPQPDDCVYEIQSPQISKKIVTIRRLEKNGNSHITDYYISKGGFVMEEVHIAVFRKTALGNQIVKRSKFMASANNF
ncbi:hypothetical protein CNR22_04860 [Sphingobacteriaceae bacterium]|nr:hypothetical protein CNR22_04860 [Sphingobacteriaceae bacterium]